MDPEDILKHLRISLNEQIESVIHALKNPHNSEQDFRRLQGIIYGFEFTLQELNRLSKEEDTE